MALDPAAAAVVDAMRANGFTGFAKLGVERSRELVDAMSRPGRGPEVSSVEDVLADDVPVRVYRPVGAPALPVVVYLHGGGFVLGSLDSHDELCRSLAVGVGAAVVAVGYRLAPEHPFPAAIDDAWSATRWVFDRGPDLGLDVTRVAVAGDSAGGNLAAVVAQLSRDAGLALRSQVLIYPVIDRRLDRPSMVDNAEGYVLERADMEWFWQHYDPEGRAASDPTAVPLARGDLSGLAPALVITAEHDPLRDEGEEYAARLEDAGVPTKVLRFDGVFHGFVQMPGLLPAADEATAAITEQLADAFT